MGDGITTFTLSAANSAPRCRNALGFRAYCEPELFVDYRLCLEGTRAGASGAGLVMVIFDAEFGNRSSCINGFNRTVWSTYSCR